VSAPTTRVLPYTAETIAEAARLIAAGQPVAMPTETVYGLAADATNGEAVARIYEAKGRPSFNPLIVHVLDMDQAFDFGARPSVAAREAAAIYWGKAPLTIVVPLSPFARISRLVTAGLGTVALRCSAHPAMMDLLRACGTPLAAPSANRSGRISPTRAEHVLASLDGRIPLIVDGGESRHGLESTIIKITGEEVVPLRLGPVDAAEVAMLIKMKYGAKWKGLVEAPGQLESHYAPSKPLRLNVEKAAPDEWLIGFGAITGETNLSASSDLVEAASKLFEKLHEAELQDRPRIAIAPIPDEDLGAAINDRLRRAAAPRHG